MNQTAILIPAYRPDDALVSLVNALRAQSFAVCVVDDGSGPAYKPVFQHAEAAGAMVLSYPDNQGKGYALKKGIAFAFEQHYARVITADADGQHAVADIVALDSAMQAHSNDTSLFLGVRNVAEMPPRSKFGNSVTCSIFHLLYGKRLTDTQTGLRGIPLNAHTVAALLNIAENRYEYEMKMLVHFKEIFGDIAEHPIQTIYIDDNQSSHFNPIVDSFHIYRILLLNFNTFLIASLTSFLVDYLLFNLLIYQFVFSTIAATICARIVSATFNYNINKRFVFQTQNSKYTFARYALLCITILVINSAMSFLAVDVLCIAPWLAKLIIESVLYVLSFCVQSRLSNQT